MSENKSHWPWSLFEETRQFSPSVSIMSPPPFFFPTHVAWAINSGPRQLWPISRSTPESCPGSKQRHDQQSTSPEKCSLRGHVWCPRYKEFTVVSGLHRRHTLVRSRATTSPQFPSSQRTFGSRVLTPFLLVHFRPCLQMSCLKESSSR